MGKDRLIIYTSAIAFFIGCLFTWQLLQEGVRAEGVICVSINFLYCALVPFIRRQALVVFHAIYGASLFYIIAKNPAALYNNYTILLITCITAIHSTKYKSFVFLIYAIFATVTLILSGATLAQYLVHASRAAWVITIFFDYTKIKIERRELVLTDAEKLILDQLAAGKQQKEIREFSKNTISRKLKEARERNGITSNNDLITLYRLQSFSQR